MKPLEYAAPGSLEDAVAMLADRGDRARPFAGGTDLLVRLRSGRADLDLLVDLKRIPELTQLSYDPIQGLTLGAAVPCCHIYEDPQVRALYPALVDSTSLIGGVAIQGRATVGGNLCNAAPSGDSIPSLMVMGASCRIVGAAGSRVVPVEDFCTGPGRNTLEPGELLLSIHIPPPQPRGGARYLRFIPRNEMDIAVVGVGASIALSEDLQRIVSARIALGAVAPTPLLVREAGESLVGKTPSEDAFGEAATMARESACPITDMRGSIAYRQHLVEVLTRRALQGAMERVQGNSQEKRTYGY